MPAQKPCPERPNVVLINCDDLGYGDIGCYGSELHSTPRLDQMAAEGVRFTDFYQGAPLCSPSRAGMMTGCYPKRVGLHTGHHSIVLFPNDPVGLHPDEVTIADVLKARGYATHIIGKWHCGDQPEFLPTNHGFDSYFGIPFSNDMGLEHPSNAKLRMPPLPLMRDEEVVEEEPYQAGLTARYTSDAVRCMREHCDEPFFLYMAHMYVHLPLYAPYGFIVNSRDGSYGAVVEHMDFCTGVLLDELKALGIDERTIVIFTSDNGGTNHANANASNAPLRGWKGQTWEGGLRVPFIVRWPGVVPAGAECQELVTAMDLLPTLAALTGAQTPADRTIDGRDISPLLFGEPDARSPHDAFYYYRAGNLAAVRDQRYKLHVESGQLYDLRDDVGESIDVAADHPDVVARLREVAQVARGDLGDDATGAEGSGCRPVGRVDAPTPLTEMDWSDPYWQALYD